MTEEDRNYQLRIKNRKLKFRNMFLIRVAAVFALIAILQFITLIFIHIKH